MRPRTLDEVVGQDHILGPGRVLRRAIEADRVPSMVLWGPPGTGKTTIAEVVARTTHARFVALSAVSAGVADLRKVVDEARRMPGTRTILFIDEIHRFNKGQQDAVLPHVENGTVTLIGATTENPSFEVNAALLSRVRVYTLHALSEEDVELLVRRALQDEVRGLAGLRPRLADDAIRHLVNRANGDARIALNALELAVESAAPNAGGERVVTLDLIQEALQQRALLYDRAGEQHYDLISAFIKSVRGSDPDAAVYWLARMLEAGEDLMFIARRLVILAGEDVGLADPHALPVAVAAQQAAHFIGLPEGNTALAQAAIYLATAPKSNAVYRAYGAAAEDAARQVAEPVPLHLRNAPTKLMKQLDYGKGYEYAHDAPDAIADMECLPPSLRHRTYYEPKERGFEKEIKRRLDGWKQIKQGRRTRDEGRGTKE